MSALAILARFWQPIVAVVAVVCITLAVRGYGERRYEAGVMYQRGVDDRATAALHAQVAALTAENKRVAAEAHSAYEVEHAQTLLAARRPLTGRELCGPENARSERVSAAGSAKPGDAAEPAAAGLVREVPPPDYGQFGDRLRLLGAIAALSDDQSAVIREFQAREQTQR